MALDENAYLTMIRVVKKWSIVSNIWHVQVLKLSLHKIYLRKLFSTQYIYRKFKNISAVYVCCAVYIEDMTNCFDINIILATSKTVTINVRTKYMV